LPISTLFSNPAVHSWEGWFNTIRHAGVRPLLKLSYTLNWVSGLGLFGYHLFNTVVHAVNALLVYFLSRKFMDSCPGLHEKQGVFGPAFFAALLFAIHPVQTESITYISGRSSSLMAMFYLCSLLTYIYGVEARKWQWHRLVSPLCFIAAVATKEVAVTLPAALLLWEITAGRRNWKAVIRDQAVHWVVLLFLMVAILTHQRYLELLMFSSQIRNAHDNLLTQVNGITYLLSRLILVNRLNIDPDLPAISRLDATVLMELALFACLTVLAIWKRRQRPWLMFGILWFFLTLIPSNSIIARLDIVNERHLYLANFGVFLILSIEGARLMEYFATYRRAWMGVVCALALVLAISTVIRNGDYRNEITLWENTVRNSPQKARGFNNLGCAYELGDLPGKAALAYEQALRLDPRHEYATANSGRLLLKRGGVKQESMK
jgi:protein O-mannosyl-transferase